MKYKVGDHFLFDCHGGTGLYEVISQEPKHYFVLCVAHTNPAYRYLDSQFRATVIDEHALEWDIVNYDPTKDCVAVDPEIGFDRDAPSDDYSDAFDILKSMLGG